ncbi:hypothetical protein AR505_0877 [methanogenic archaeon ISO4-H5]|nr:hypothetical protein AR505_0877 [methanogenic archaeon ISO4-H5]
MDGQLLEVLIALFAIFGGLLPMILSHHYPFKKSPFQIVFLWNGGENKIVVRNVGTIIVFIDEIKLHKYPDLGKLGIRDITSRFNITRNSTLLPGNYIVATFDEDDLKTIVLENYRYCFNKDFNGKGKCRLSYKITLESSEGNIGTKWFKIGNKYGHWRFYDFMWKQGSYYPTGKQFERLFFERFIYILVVFSVILISAASETDSQIWKWASLFLPLLCLLIGCLGATDGYRTRVRVAIDSFVYSFPIVVWVYYMIFLMDLTVIIGIFIIGYVEIAFRKLSGWDL